MTTCDKDNYSNIRKVNIINCTIIIFTVLGSKCNNNNTCETLLRNTTCSNQTCSCLHAYSPYQHKCFKGNILYLCCTFKLLNFVSDINEEYAFIILFVSLFNLFLNLNDMNLQYYKVCSIIISSYKLLVIYTGDYSLT